MFFFHRNSAFNEAKVVFVLTLALAVNLFVSFFRLLRTISRRSGFVTSKASFINSSFEGSLDIITAIVCVKAL